MAEPDDNSPPYEETGVDRRQGLLADNALSLDLVFALAGDRQLTETEKIRLSEKMWIFNTPDDYNSSALQDNQ